MSDDGRVDRVLARLAVESALESDDVDEESSEERPAGQVCPNPECHINQRWPGFRGLCCPECAIRLVVACAYCDSGAVSKRDGSPVCRDHETGELP